jgi:hypothetical protein
MEALEEEIAINYDERPIIVICESHTKDKVVDILERNKFLKFKIGVSVDVIKEIRAWEYGVLILEPSEGVGVNTRFAKDSLVLIATKVENKAEYEQFMGRSSRTRGMCKGIYFCESNLSSA